MYEVWYDYSKSKYGKKVRYIKYIKTDDINKDRLMKLDLILQIMN